MIRATLVALAFIAVTSVAYAQRVPSGFEQPLLAPTRERLELAGEPIANLQWVEQPEARDFARAYPRPAMGRVNANVTIDCLIQSDGRFACIAEDDGFEDYDFEWATLLIATKFRVGPETRDGQPTAARRLRRTIRWVTAQ